MRPPTEIVGELVRSAAALATEAGANRFEVDYDPVCGFARDVLAASELAWQVRESGDRALAEIALADTRATAAPPVAGSASVVGTHLAGVTLLPSAEGPSLRSDPRWTARQARRSERLLERLVTRRRSLHANV